MTVDTGTCFDCCFWAALGPRGDPKTRGECTATEAHEATTSVIVRQTLDGTAYAPVRRPEDFDGHLVTPPDFFCASWQIVRELQE